MRGRSGRLTTSKGAKRGFLRPELGRRIVAAILSKTRPTKIVLFGSRARGEARRNSDMDILVIAPSRLPRWRRTPELYQALAGLDPAKDIVWWTPGEVTAWSRVPSHFISTALREGKVLYEKPA